jgi:GR25 family glycosyltransferase involved in LPS biosynthesis
MNNQRLHTIVINLYNRQNRYINTINELRKLGLSKFVTRFEAKTPEDAEKYFKLLHRDAYNNINNTQNMNIIPSYAAFACFLSHLECWNYVIENNINDCLIIEDDIEIDNKNHFLMDYANFIDIIEKNNKSIRHSMFITFNSQNFGGFTNINNCSFNKNGLNGMKYINYPFCGTHFYYINKNMALFLKNSFKKIKYQIDIEIGLLAEHLSKEHTRRISQKKIFLNIPNASITQSKKFNSDIQYYCLTLKELNRIINTNKEKFKLPEVICQIIFDFIPYCFKNVRKNEKLSINNIDHHNIRDKLDDNIYFYNMYGDRQ